MAYLCNEYERGDAVEIKYGPPDFKTWQLMLSNRSTLIAY